MNNDCTQLRRKLIRHGTLGHNGDVTNKSEEWTTEPCGIPMFSAAERERGTCRSCAAGWTHEHNYPVVQS